MGVDMHIIIEYRFGMDEDWLEWAELADEPRYSYWREYVEGGMVSLGGEWNAVDFWSIEQTRLSIPVDPDDREDAADSPVYAALRALAGWYGPNNARMRWRRT